MKDIYNISKGQLITIWVFAIVFAVFSSESYNETLQALGLVLFFGTIFYTLGWRKHR